jgi:hypothetical protein
MSTLKKLLLIWLALLVLLLVGSRFIVTDAKRVNRVLQAVEQSVRDADADGVMDGVARDYQYEGLDWQTLHDRVEGVFRRSRFSTTVIRDKRIQVTGDAAEVRLTVLAQPATGSRRPGSNTSWRLQLERRDRVWWITEIELLTVNGHSLGTLKQMIEAAESMSGE